MKGERVIRFLMSVKTSVWLLSLLLGACLAGAFIMPSEKAFQSIHDLPLLRWMQEQPLRATWWMWASVALLCVLAINTIVCSVDSVIRKRKVTQWLLLISPQVIHIGFLFMLLAHLMSGWGSFKTFEVGAEGTVLGLSDTEALRVKAIAISTDRLGYLIDWAVDIEYLSEGRLVREDRLLPNQPFFQGGIGVYVKDLRAFPQKLVLLELSREPGAVWALVGGVLFMIGTVTLLMLKMKREPRE
jgi:cytochrome c biogenesis protein ResB